MNRCEEELLDRAYQRRAELLAEPGLRWVRMHLEASSVTLIIESAEGELTREVLQRQSEPGDGRAGNGAYDRD